jgi:rhamnose utilization protein RhaD (predicted bifunctional aldolase and dehydrogenase)/NAD(P)-dependent dehydrogenase (short-subunit alcohol dehydrogenase family)
VYTSRLIGRNPALVLHGGGNTSVKTRLKDDLGAAVEVLCVKGSGWNLHDIEPAGLPAIRLDSTKALRKLKALSDEDMVNAQRTRLLDASAPSPSVEALLHAFLPAKFIDHSHADACLSIADQPDSEALCRQLYGDRLAFVPYVMPGFALAALAADLCDKHPAAQGMLLGRHGLFTWGATAKESYDRHIDAVTLAEQFIASRRKPVAQGAAPPARYADFAACLRGLLGERSRRYLLTLRTSDRIRDFLLRADLADVSQRGTATPDHVIRTKRLPLLLDAAQLADATAREPYLRERLDAYRAAYNGYFKTQSARRPGVYTELDRDPRIILVPGVGLIAAGKSMKDACIAADVYEHTVDVITDAEAVGRYEVLSESDLFDMEYWSLEQAKLGKDKPKPLAGQVVYITGAGRGIGEAVARAFAAQGAHLYLVDRDAEPLAAVAKKLGGKHEVLDVTSESAVRASVQHCVEAFGGVDGCVSNAGTAPQGQLHSVSTELLKQSFEINLFSHQYVAAAVTNVLRAQGTGGFLLFNASKSAFNPGPDFGPYAMPKSALVTMMKQYAIEQAGQGIRSNAINADRIRTGLLSQADLAARAKSRGLDPEAYWKANLLGREVTADDVANAFVWLAQAASTTGSVVTVDGGNIAASPR